MKKQGDIIMIKKIITLIMAVILTLFTVQTAFAVNNAEQVESATASVQTSDKKADVSVSAEKLLLASGEKATLTIKYSIEKIDVKNDIIKVVSSNKAVASFKIASCAKGVATIEVTGVKAGTAEITVTLMNKSTDEVYDSETVKVTVTNDVKPSVSAIENISTTTDKNADVKVKVNNASYKYAVVIKSSNKNVADVEISKFVNDEASLTIIPKFGGTSEITVTLYEDNTYTNILDTETFTVKVDNTKFSFVEFIMNIINFILNLFK